ncbi:MAG TPA: hypothetical protein VM492_18235 [Sumerlaeia bacterium]|nr:hypothetical protein [Sumerlaeia bacterium]
MRQKTFHVSRMFGATLLALALSFGVAARGATAFCGKAGCGSQGAACCAWAQPAKRPQCAAAEKCPKWAAKAAECPKCAPGKRRLKCLAGAANCPRCTPGEKCPKCAQASQCPKPGTCCQGLRCKGKKAGRAAPAGNFRARGAGEQFVRGVTNVGFCWFEVVDSAQQSLIAHEGWGLGGILGKSIYLPFAVVGGAFRGAERAASGVVETAFSPFPPHGSMIDPAYPPYLRSAEGAAGKGACPCAKPGNCPKCKVCPKRKAGGGPKSCPKGNSRPVPEAEASGCSSQ